MKLEDLLEKLRSDLSNISKVSVESINSADFKKYLEMINLGSLDMAFFESGVDLGSCQSTYNSLKCYIADLTNKKNSIQVQINNMGGKHSMIVWFLREVMAWEANMDPYDDQTQGELDQLSKDLHSQLDDVNSKLSVTTEKLKQATMSLTEAQGRSVLLELKASEIKGSVERNLISVFKLIYLNACNDVIISFKRSIKEVIIDVQLLINEALEMVKESSSTIKANNEMKFSQINDCYDSIRKYTDDRLFSLIEANTSSSLARIEELITTEANNTSDILVKAYLGLGDVLIMALYCEDYQKLCQISNPLAGLSKGEQDRIISSLKSNHSEEDLKKIADSTFKDKSLLITTTFTEKKVTQFDVVSSLVKNRINYLVVSAKRLIKSIKDNAIAVTIGGVVIIIVGGTIISFLPKKQ